MAAKNKSYLNNPALQFISSALVDEANAVPDIPAAAPAAPVQSAAPQPVYAPVQTASAMHEVSSLQGATVQAGKFIVPMKPVFVETRSKRFNALMQPSLYDNLRKIAALNGVSVNELMHRVLEKFVEDNLQ